MRIALYEPDIPQNTGTILRLAACMGVPVDLIAPAGFDMTDRALRRAGLDYLAHVELARHRLYGLRGGAPVARHRLVLLTTRGETPYTDMPSAKAIACCSAAKARACRSRPCGGRCPPRIPMRAGLRSLNVAVAAAMVLGEALRQTGGFAPSQPPRLDAEDGWRALRHGES